MANTTPLNRLVDRAADLAGSPDDTDDERLKKAIFVILALTGALIITPIWGTLYLLLGEPMASLGPYGFMVVAAIFVGYALRTGGVGPFPFILAYYNLASSIWIHVALGGYHGSSAVMLWAVFTPVGLLLFLGRRPAFLALPIFLASVAVLGLFEGTLAEHAGLPDGVVAAFYVLNIGAASVVLFAILLYSILERDRAQERSDFLLLNILPRSIAERLKREPGTIADRFDETTILYMDLVGFTPLSAELPAEYMVTWLNGVYSDIDQMVITSGAEKIKTIGDTVNTANRMESHGEAGQIQVSASTYELLADRFVLEPRGLVEIKGKGLMETFYLVAEKEPSQDTASV